MARPKDNKDRIVNAALKTFVTKGYQQTTVAEISKEAGLAEGTLYNYYSSKEELLLAVFDDKWGGIIEDIRRKIVRIDDPNDKMKTMFSMVVRMFKKDRDLAEIFLIDVKQSSIFINNYPVNRVVEFIDLIEEILIEGKKKGVYRKDLDTKVAKMVIFGAAQGIMLSWVLSESAADNKKSYKMSLIRASRALRDIFKYGL
jgi:TetR/AcrR family fatty acid metabolism transcriptional regulator